MMDWFAGVTASDERVGVGELLPPQSMMLRQSARPTNVANVRRRAAADWKIDACVSKISSACSNRNQDCGGRASFVIIAAVMNVREKNEETKVCNCRFGKADGTLPERGGVLSRATESASQPPK
jgi:hypothetical protein